uniref:poly(ADP-ribose) glycohydrolase n=1 Tax=Poecilia reticulata TaxID=8081 RepID=A0A3P9PLJ8_POERE
MENKNHHNDSSQVKECIQMFDPLHSEKEKPKSENQQNGKDGSTQASSSNPSTSGHSCNQNTRKASKHDGDSCNEDAKKTSKRDGDSCNEDGSKTAKHMPVGTAHGEERSEVGLSCCQLDELKTLPQCDIKLGKLTFSKSHTVLIDVSCFRLFLFHMQRRSIPFSCIFICCDPVRQPDPPWCSLVWKIKSTATFILCLMSLSKRHECNSLCLCVQAIPLLQRHQPASITLSQAQISCLLANAFYCTFPHRNTTSSKAEYHNYPFINFSRLFGNWSERKNQKFKAIMHYFNVMTDERAKPEGLVTFERRWLSDAEAQAWGKCTHTLQKLHVTSEGRIEGEGAQLLQVDFAASRVGGGVLDSGLVQEEILFLMNPELIVARLFTEKLDKNECLIITGTQQFSCYSGFSDSFQWLGPYDDHLERDEWRRLKRQILAIDACHFKHPIDQYNMEKVRRELNKVSHCVDHKPDIATGKQIFSLFGCFFKSDTEALRGLAFFTFGDHHLCRRLQQTYHLCHHYEWFFTRLPIWLFSFLSF